LKKVFHLSIDVIAKSCLAFCSSSRSFRPRRRCRETIIVDEMHRIGRERLSGKQLKEECGADSFISADKEFSGI
jgi:hypothetical protein